MSGFIKWLKKHVCEDDAWITVQSNGGGRHVLLNDDGTIKAGMGGKFNGQRIDLIPRKKSAPPTGNETIKVAEKRYTLSAPQTSATQSNRPTTGSLSEKEKNLYQKLQTAKSGRSAIEKELAQTQEKIRQLEDEEEILQNPSSKKYQSVQQAREIADKRLPVPDGQKRLLTPVKIERETEKAVGVRNKDYEDAKAILASEGGNKQMLSPYHRRLIDERKSLTWYPKSRVTSAEGHLIGAENWLLDRSGELAEDKAIMNEKYAMSFDSAPSQRRVDENGFMHVDSCHVTKEQVVKYYGREIPGWRELGLDPERPYNVYRPADEIEKAAATFDGLPLQLQHHIDSADEPQTEFRVGSISRPVWRAPYLDCDLHITNGAAISAVEHGDFKEISAAYLYEPVVESGEFDGTPYEIVMRNLRGNHVALVPKGRAGADVVVADEAPDAPPLRSFAAWMRKNPLSLKDAPSPEWEATRNALDNN